MWNVWDSKFDPPWDYTFVVASHSCSCTQHNILWALHPLLRHQLVSPAGNQPARLSFHAIRRVLGVYWISGCAEGLPFFFIEVDLSLRLRVPTSSRVAATPGPSSALHIRVQGKQWLRVYIPNRCRFKLAAHALSMRVKAFFGCQWVITCTANCPFNIAKVITKSDSVRKANLTTENCSCGCCRKWNSLWQTQSLQNNLPYCFPWIVQSYALPPLYAPIQHYAAVPRQVRLFCKWSLARLHAKRPRIWRVVTAAIYLLRHAHVACKYCLYLSLSCLLFAAAAALLIHCRLLGTCCMIASASTTYADAFVAAQKADAYCLMVLILLAS